MSTRTPLVLGALLLVPTFAQAQAYAFRTIEPSAGFAGSQAADIDNYGTVAGDVVLPSSSTRAVVWYADGTEHRLGELTTGGYSRSRAISPHGIVAGIAQTGGTSYQAFVYDDFSGMQGLAPGQLSTYSDVNDFGVAVGERGSKAIRRDRNGVTFLGTLPGGTVSEAYGVNASGTIVGRGSTAVSQGGFASEYRGFVWSGNGLVALPSLAATGNTYALGINDAGTIVGTSQLGNTMEAVVWEGGSIRTLVRPTNSAFAQARSINASGAILGQAFDVYGYDRPVLWNATGALTQLDGLGTDGWQIRNATGMNDLGQIVGTAYRNGVMRAYVLTPVPEPATFAALGLGALALLRRRR